MFTLTSINPGRISAEKRPYTAGCLPARVICANVVLVAGPSKQMPVTRCKNRYPSPTKRPDHFLVRLFSFLLVRRRIAHHRASFKKTFALALNNRDYAGIKQPEKGNRVCKRKFGFVRSRRWSVYRPVVIRCWNRACLAPVLGLVLQLFWVVTPQLARSLVVRAMSCIVSKTHRSVDLIKPDSAPFWGRNGNGHRGAKPVAVFRCVTLFRNLFIIPKGLHHV